MISVIFPAYNEADNLKPLMERLRVVADSMKPVTFEFLFVDDASGDETPRILKELRAADKRVRVIRFVTNAGSHAALSAGLRNAKGEAAIVMAADLQDPPELIVDLVEKWKGNAQVVWGVRADRQGESLATKLFSRLYYFLVNGLTKVKMPPTGADVFLIGRAVMDAFNSVSEKHTSVFMTVAWLGFPQDSIFYIKKPRFSGKSKWTLKKKFKLALDSFVSFSDAPARVMSAGGILIGAVGLCYAANLIYLSLSGVPVERVSWLIVVVLLIGGIQMVMLGLLCEYVWRIYDASRKRPMYMIEYQLD